MCTRPGTELCGEDTADTQDGLSCAFRVVLASKGDHAYKKWRNNEAEANTGSARFGARWGAVVGAADKCLIRGWVVGGGLLGEAET